MKFRYMLAAMLLWSSVALGQTGDPVLMTVNGKPVLRSEFEYAYNKNRGGGQREQVKVADYLPLFVNYRLKVEAAHDAHLDTLPAFKHEFESYRDQQIKPMLVDQMALESEARKIYTKVQQEVDANGGMAEVAHILIRIPQKATPEQVKQAKVSIDSIYTALLNGADFATLARQVSQDSRSAVQGGKLPPFTKGQTYKEFENVVWGLKDGELSRPFETPLGWHIVKKNGHRGYDDYNSVRDQIMRYIDQRGIREAMANAQVSVMAARQQSTPEKVLDDKCREMMTANPSLRHLIQEYHDGLLVYNISKQRVWDKTETDSVGLRTYYLKNKKRYAWTQPRYKGLAYRTATKKDLKGVKKALKKEPYERWDVIIKEEFNKDSVARVIGEKGIFKLGDNDVVDQKVFKQNKPLEANQQYPYVAVYGKKLKAPQSLSDVASLVLADYQEYLEQQWTEELRKRYPVIINMEVVKTVNKH